MTTVSERPVAAAEPAIETTSSLQDFRDRRAAQLMIVIGAWVVVPRLIQSLLAPKYRFQIGAANVPYVTAAAYTQRLLFYAIVGLCLWIVAESFNNPPKGRGFTLVVFLAPSFYLSVRDVYLSQPFQNTRYLFPLVVIALWVLRPRIKQLATLGFMVGLTITLCVLLGVVLPAKGVFHNADGDVISQDKQILPIGILIGIFTQGNNLGQFIALGLPSITLIRQRKTRLFFIAVSLFALIWCASRSAYLSVGLSVLAVLVTRLAKRPDTRRLFAIVAATAPFVLVCVLPFITHDPGAFTTRGYIWQQSLLEWHTSRTFGLGAYFYSILGQSSASLGTTVFHGHNELVQLLVTGGVVLACLVGLLMGLAVLRASRLAADGTIFGVGYVAGFAGACVLEVSLVLVDNDILFPVMVVPLAVIVFSDEVRERARARVPAGAALAKREHDKYLRTKGSRR